MGCTVHHNTFTQCVPITLNHIELKLIQNLWRFTLPHFQYHLNESNYILKAQVNKVRKPSEHSFATVYMQHFYKETSTTWIYITFPGYETK